MMADGKLKPGSVGLNCAMVDGGVEQLQESHWIAGDGQGQVLKLQIANDERFVDNLTGHQLDPALCRAARKKEMDFVREKGLAQAQREGVLGYDRWPAYLRQVGRDQQRR